MKVLSKKEKEAKNRNMANNVVELEEITVCPNCRNRIWEVVETRSSNGPFCRCAECGWQEIEAKKTEDGISQRL